MSRRAAIFALCFSLSTAFALEAPAPRLAKLRFPGPASFQAIARDITDVAFTVDPSLASNAGLFDDALRVPSYAPAQVDALVARLRADRRKLRASPWRQWDPDVQLDARWLYAVAETVEHALVVERVHERRPGQWLEPVANNLIALESFGGGYGEERVLAQVPAMVAEMRTVLVAPTRRDLHIGIGLARAVEGLARPIDPKAADALAAWATDAAALRPDREFAVIGPEAYAWRYEHALLFPWTPTELEALARKELARVESELATLRPEPLPGPSDEERQLARDLDQARLLRLYDSISEQNRAATVAGGWVTVPDTLGPLRTRPTPPGLIPLTGDGGSMNPPPTYAKSNVGYWNVETFSPSWSEARRTDAVMSARQFLDNGMGTYSAHEGWPGHHLQLSIARLNPDPIRSILPDCPQNEGWALYAEETFAAHGGLGTGDAARRTVLGSYRARIARVVYDVNIETGVWTLEQAAAFKMGNPDAKPDEDVLRSINWPTQLICYFAGKQLILSTRDALRARQGAAFDERAFHDALLAAGSVPLALTRARLLGEPIPDFPKEF